MIFLHLESLENKLFELDFSMFQKACFYDQIFLHGHDIFFFGIIALFHAQKKLLKVSRPFLKKKFDMSQEP